MRNHSASLCAVNSAARYHAPSDSLSNAAMQTIAEIRRARLGELRTKHGSWAEINRKLGMLTRDATFSQIWNRAPDSRTGRPREMGTELARKIEDALELPRGWMDTSGVLGAIAIANEPRAPYRASAGWPFSFDRSRFDALSKPDRNRVEGAALAIIIECEARPKNKRSRAKHMKRSA